MNRRELPISVTETARRAFIHMEPALQQELIEHLASVGSEPATMLVRAPVYLLPATYMSWFDSMVQQGVRITALFAGFDDDPPTLTLLSIGTHHIDPDDPQD